MEPRLPNTACSLGLIALSVLLSACSETGVRTLPAPDELAAEDPTTHDPRMDWFVPPEDPPVEDSTDENTPPGAPEVTVLPPEPLPDDDLVCWVSSSSQDADGDSVSYRFEWLLDGDGSGFDEALLPATATEADDYWTCVVTPSDGLTEGPPGAASVLIGFEENLGDPPQPLLHYTFDGHLLDVTGNGYDGIGYGNLSYVGGALGQGLALDGDSSWVDTGFAMNLGDFTASVWINNALSPNQKGPIVDRFPDWRLANEDGNVDEPWLSGQGLEASAFDSWSTGGPRYGVGYETTSQDQWVHLALVYDGLGMLLYVDGSLVDSTGAPGRSETPGTIWLGRKHLATTQYLEGALDDFILWDEALSPEEIASLLDGL